MKRLTRVAAMALLAVVATGLLVAACSGCKAKADKAAQKAPIVPASNFAIRPYVLLPGQTEMTIQWTTVQPHDAVLRYGPPSNLDHRQPTTCRELVYYPNATKTDRTREPKKIEYVYSARLTDLSPGTCYAYTVEADKESVGGQFRTLPGGTAPAGPFNFAAYGDSRTGVAAHRSVAEAIRSAEPAFILHTGDLTGNGAFALYRPEFFDPLYDVIDHIPMFTVAGNHEGEWKFYHELLRMPGNGQWYSFDYGNVHVVGLDSNAGKVNLPEMLDWLEQDLAATHAEWKVVFYHHPTYDVARRHTMWGRTKVAPLLRRYKVDIVLAGHSHSYQRLFPMYTKGENEDHPITYMVTAGGGASMTGLESSSYAAMAVRKFHFVLFSIDGAKLTARAIGADGQAFDTFQIDKAAGRPDAAYLASALPEEDFDKLRDLLAVQVRRLYMAELPQPNRPATFTFPITGCPPGGEAIKLKLFLDDEKGPYALDAVRVTCPAGETVQVTATIHTKTKVSSGKGNLLDPEVAFECHYECGKQKGVVISGKLRFGEPPPNDPATRPAENTGGDE